MCVCVCVREGQREVSDLKQLPRLHHWTTKHADSCPLSMCNSSVCVYIGLTMCSVHPSLNYNVDLAVLLMKK